MATKLDSVSAKYTKIKKVIKKIKSSHQRSQLRKKSMNSSGSSRKQESERESLSSEDAPKDIGSDKEEF